MNELTEIEKRFAVGIGTLLDGDLIGFDKEDPQYWPEIRDRMKRIAFHEAGHFVAKLFTELELHHVVKISIIRDAKGYGYVMSERPFARATLDLRPPPMQRSSGRMLLIHTLAGYGAESIWDQSNEWNSIYEFWNSLHYFDDVYLEDDSDYNEAFQIAEIVKKPFMPVSRILTLADKWTLEMLQIPAVWNAVETVATKLIEKGEITDGSEDYNSIMYNTNCPNAYSFIKWRRRLF